MAVNVINCNAEPAKDYQKNTNAVKGLLCIFLCSSFVAKSNQFKILARVSCSLARERIQLNCNREANFANDCYSNERVGEANGGGGSTSQTKGHTYQHNVRVESLDSGAL